jgi:YidC/Oxa1 family membrane protein insertase
MENRRFILFVLLGVVLFFMYEAWQQDYASPAVPDPTPVAAANVPADDDIPSAAVNADAAGTPLAVPTGSLIEVQTDVLRVEIATVGGELRRAELLGYPEHKEHADRPLALLDDRAPRWFVLQSGVAGTQAPLTTPQTQFIAPQARYVLGAGEDMIDVPLRYVDASGYAVTKTFRFERGSYQVGLTQTLKNSSAQDLAASPYVRYQRTVYSVGGEPRFTPTFLGVGVYEQRGEGNYRFRKESFEDLDDETIELKQSGGWLAMLQHYFVAAIIPPDGEVLSFSAKPGRERGYLAQYVGATEMVPAGAEHAFSTRLYLGPKLQGSIGELAPGFELTLDYGILTALAKPLFWVLEQFHKLTGNWGWAIVLLTLAVGTATYKLSEAQYRSMAKMKKYAPKIQDIKERYADDRERLQKAMMDLYKKEGFNPLAGCWPLLVQMPVFFALYWVLLESVELRQAPFALWMQDLSAPDPYYVLPLLYGLTIFIQQKLSGQQMMDPMQQKIMNVMPIALTAFFVFFQSGLVLYWLVSNCVGIAQQWYITRKLEKEGLKH